MTERQTIAARAAQQLRDFAASAEDVQVLLGFDGFVDSIIQVVDKRHDGQNYDAIPLIETFGQRIVAAAGQSSNFELVTTLRKLGGNGPIMANAMAAAGIKVNYVGCLGYPQIDPVFEELADRAASVHSIAEEGTTDALEFTDGKLMLGKYAHLDMINYDRVCQTMGEDTFRSLCSQSQLIGMVNWTMLPEIETIWQAMADDILPSVGSEVAGRRRMLFIDLCDPAKRTVEDLQGALSLCSRLDKQVDVILGMNLKEAGQVAAALGVAIEGDPEAAIQRTAEAIRETMDIFAVVVHPRRGAAGAVRTDEGVESAVFYGPFTSKPKLSTGAGDNFNAGFCVGLLAGLPVQEALCVGTATSGYYVRNGQSPSLDQLAEFCDRLPEPELV